MYGISLANLRELPGGNILESSVDGIPDWPGFEPRGGRHSAVPSYWAGSGANS